MWTFVPIVLLHISNHTTRRKEGKQYELSRENVHKNNTTTATSIARGNKKRKRKNNEAKQ